MDQIEKLFKNYGNCSSVEEYKYQEKLVQENDGIQVNSREENGYIDIEYVNRIGEYKAKMLIQIFDEYKEFYQYFLKNFRKIIIQNNRKSEKGDELIINNEPCSIDLYDLIKQVLSSYPSSYFDSIFTKMESQKNLLAEDKAIDLIRYVILKENEIVGKIDFFKYLELVHGKFINVDSYYESALIDLTFKYHNYSILEQYMNCRNQEEIKIEIFKALHSMYGLVLLNESLKHQKKIFDRSNDIFLKNNLTSLNMLFNEQIYPIIGQYQNEGSRNSISISRDETLNLAYEFLDEIDSTGVLKLELKKNVENNSIILWNSNDTDERKKMQEKYGKDFSIDKPLCYSWYRTDGSLISSVVNVPLKFTLEDVFTLIHEFFHFHSNYSSPQRKKSNLLAETFSIYFENLILIFLKKKSYSEENLPINFRVVDAVCNFVNISPSINFFSQYMQMGKIDMDYLYGIMEMVEKDAIKACDQLGLLGEERKNELKKWGIYDSIEASIINWIYNINNILLCNDESIYRGSPYLFGAILSKFAMDNNVPLSEMLQFCADLNVIEDPCIVMERLGIDLKHYGFQHVVSAKDVDTSDVEITGIRKK